MVLPLSRLLDAIGVLKAPSRYLDAVSGSG